MNFAFASKVTKEPSDLSAITKPSNISLTTYISSPKTNTGIKFWQYFDLAYPEPQAEYYSSSALAALRLQRSRTPPAPSEDETETEQPPSHPSPRSPTPSDDHSEDYLPTPIAHTMTTTPKETLKGNKPKPFTGDRSSLDDFITDCQLYLAISAPKADGPSKKAWVLTFIQGGEAAGWKNQYIASPDYNTDTYDQFIARFTLAFKDPQEKVNARIAISRLWQNTLPIDAYYSKFILLVNKAGITDDLEKSHLFISPLHPDLHSKLAGFLDPSATFQEQFKLARNVSSSMAVFVASKGRTKNHYQTKKDDNAMDVDKQKARGQKIPPLT